MGKEAVSNYVGPESGTTVCPKCGFEQETRPDCKKCGVVFSKYYALFPSGKEESGGAPHPQPEPDCGGNADLQPYLNELSAKLREVEFERVVRNNLQLDLKSLDQRFQESMADISARLEKCERQCEAVADPLSRQESVLSEIVNRLDCVEDQLRNLDQFSSQIVSLNEQNIDTSRQVSELQVGASVLNDEVSSIRNQLDWVLQNQASEESPTLMEKDIHAIRKNLDDLFRLLNKPV
jgi:chromosome segregation ATPase